MQPSSFEWLIPWHPVGSEDERRGLLDELQRELPPGHALAGIRVTPIGRRQDCDDVLFSLEDGRVAVVHLTWSRKTEPAAEYPWTVVFDSLDRFVEDAMKPQHHEWG